MKPETLEKVREAKTRILKYIERRSSARGLDKEYIHVFDNDFALLASDLRALLEASPERVEESADSRQVPDEFTAVAEVFSDAVGNTDWNTLKVLVDFLPKMPVYDMKFVKKARLLYTAAPKPTSSKRTLAAQKGLQAIADCRAIVVRADDLRRIIAEMRDYEVRMKGDVPTEVTDKIGIWADALERAMGGGE
ncbi:hypothetical protein [Hydrocarboniphaga effusa]|uniref:hypothetical protein n=1 Tax=Hydrocarboniphaga effusa TaxID=243629 RepID=UPI00398BE65D